VNPLRPTRRGFLIRGPRTRVAPRPWRFAVQNLGCRVDRQASGVYNAQWPGRLWCRLRIRSGGGGTHGTTSALREH
jgi:hypothetical protein